MEASLRVTLFNPLQLTAEYCQHLQTMARNCARRIGIAVQDQEDCAGEFVLRVLILYRHRQQAGKQGKLPTAWLHRCAVNHAVDFQRRQRRMSRHETEVVPDDANENQHVYGASGPEAQALTQEFLCLLQREARALTPAQQDLFARLIINDDTASETAKAIGRTAQAIRQSQSNLCRQLRLLLERRSISEAGLREYILSTEQRHGGGDDKVNAACPLIYPGRKSKRGPRKSPLTFRARDSFILLSAMLIVTIVQYFCRQKDWRCKHLRQFVRAVNKRAYDLMFALVFVRRPSHRRNALCPH